MTDSEVNKIIAEFMGIEIQGVYGEEGRGDLYFDVGEDDIIKQAIWTKSLDALVPVWERLELEAWLSRQSTYGKDIEYHCKLHFEFGQGRDGEYWCDQKETIQLAAAHATAKAILELK